MRIHHIQGSQVTVGAIQFQSYMKSTDAKTQLAVDHSSGTSVQMF
jgi:hypothetical protein